VRAATLAAVSGERETTWDRAAPRYARQERLERQAIGRALDLAAPAADDVLLDVATGTGLVLRELARRASRPASAVGLDASAAMIARVGALPQGWRTQLGNATALPFADGSFDVVIGAYLLHVLDPTDRLASLAELHRVARPGARLVVVTTWAARPLSRALLSGLARGAPALAGLRPLDPRPEMPRAGWILERTAMLHQGYPSLVVLAGRS